MNLVDIYCDRIDQQLLKYNKIAEQYPKIRPFDIDYIPEPDEDLLWFRPRHQDSVFRENTTPRSYTYRSTTDDSLFNTSPRF